MVYVYDNEIVTYLNFGVEKTIEQVRLDETNAAIEGLKNVQILSPLLQPECVEHLSVRRTGSVCSSDWPF